MPRGRLLFTCVAVALACAFVQPVHASAQSRSDSIASYMQMPGDQVVVIPNGTYRGGVVHAPHRATSGKYRGWLVLKAEQRDHVVVDLSSGELKIASDTSRVLFVGIKFVRGSVTIAGSDIGFWYTDHSFPATVWAQQGPSGSPEKGLYHSPDAVHAYETTTRNVTFEGADLHNVGDAIDVSNSTNTHLVGVHIWDLGDDGVDPHDVVHPDAIDGVRGGSTGLQVLHSFIEGRVVLEVPANRGRDGSQRDVLFSDVWSAHAPSAGFTFSVDSGGRSGIFGQRVDVRSWGHANGHDRINNVDGTTTYDTPNTNSSRLRVTDENVVTTAPPGDALDPASVWRSAHPYNSWAQNFGFATGTTSSRWRIPLVVALLALLIALTAVFMWWRSKRRRARGVAAGG